MKKVLSIFSYLVIGLFILSVFGWMVSHIEKGDKKFGFLTEPVKFIYGFPDLFSRSVEEVRTLPKTFVPTPEDFEAINKLDSDLLVLSTYSDVGDSRTVVLRNLRNDSVLYSWNLENPNREHDRILNPLLFPDKSLVYSYDGIEGLKRIDSLGRVLWQQDSVYPHHAINRDLHGDIWICSWIPTFSATGHYTLDGRNVYFKDNHISKLDPETGRILFHRSVTAILKENGLENYLLRSQVVMDPIHLNDVEPALHSTPWFEEGDLFLSLRHPALVLHYRPSSDSVLRVIEGPFASPHDVDILNDSTLVIFNNNSYNIGTRETKPVPRDSSWLYRVGDLYSNVVSYDFSRGRTSIIGDSVFRANEIHTKTEGLQEFIDPTSYLVEEQNTAVLWVIRDDEVIYKQVHASQHEGYHHLSNWTRIINHHD